MTPRRLALAAALWLAAMVAMGPEPALMPADAYLTVTNEGIDR